MRGRGLWTLGWLFVVLALALSIAPARNGPGDPDDEGLLLVYPEQILNGAMPNRDYENFYGPGNDYALAAAYGVLGPKVGVERAVGLAYRVLIVTAVYLLGAFDGILVGFVGGLLSAAMFTYLDYSWLAFAWLGAVALALLGIWAFLHAADDSCARPKRWLAAAGALAGSAVLFRFDLLPAVALSMVPLLGWMPGGRRRWFMLGLLAPAVCLAAHLVLAGIGNVFSNVVVDGVFRTGGQSGLPLPPAFSPEWWYFVLVLGSTVVLVLAAVVARLRGEAAGTARRLFALALFAVGVVPEVLQRPDVAHFMFAGCVTVGLLPVALSSLIRNSPLRTPWRASIAGAAIALLGVYALQVDVRRILTAPNLPAAWVIHRGRKFPTDPPAKAAVIGALLNQVERYTKPGERLFVGPVNLRRTNFNDIYLYHLLPQLEPATYELDMNPGVANRPGGRLAHDVASADVLVLTNEYDALWQAIMPYSRLGSDAAVKVVARDFRLQGSYGPFRLYLRRE